MFNTCSNNKPPHNLHPPAREESPLLKQHFLTSVPKHLNSALHSACRTVCAVASTTAAIHSSLSALLNLCQTELHAIAEAARLLLSSAAHADADARLRSAAHAGRCCAHGALAAGALRAAPRLVLRACQRVAGGRRARRRALRAVAMGWVQQLRQVLGWEGAAAAAGGFGPLCSVIAAGAPEFQS